jgi:hypothetical protein
MRRLFVMRRFFVLLLVSLAFAEAQEIRSGDALLRAMHERYLGTWYQTVTFTQKSTTYKSDGTSSSETWHEAALLPGKLRIDIGPAGDGKGYLMVDGTVTVFENNKVVRSRPLVNILLALGFDVYRQESETTAKIVEGEGFDLAKIHEDTWEGHPVYVVGADKGDLKSKQFWVQKDTMLFVRVIQPARGESGNLDDIRFEDYQRLGGAWIAARVEVHSEEKKVFSEEYSEIQANVKLDPAMFDPEKFGATHWEK